MHYRYENARRDRVYGKPIPGMRVDTSELADRVGTVVFPSGMYRPIELFFFFLTGAWVSLCHLIHTPRVGIPRE